MSRTAIAREIGGAESSTTSAKDPLRSSTSAHHAAFVGSGGRTIHSAWSPAVSAQSRGASVRDASMYATHSPRLTAAATTGRSSVSLPLAPTTSVSRPRGKPPEASASSSASSPVGSPGACGSGAGSSARSDSILREESGTRRLGTAAVLTSKTRLHGARQDPKKHRKHGTGKRTRQRLSAGGFSTPSPHVFTSSPARAADSSPPAATHQRRPLRRHGRTERRVAHTLS